MNHVWYSSDGVANPVSTMDTSHLTACIEWLEAGLSAGLNVEHLTPKEWVGVFRAELHRREERDDA